MALNEFKNSVKWTSILEILIRIFSFLVGLIVVRYVSPEDLGNYYKVYTIITFISGISSPGFFTVILSSKKYQKEIYSDSAWTWDVFISNLIILIVSSALLILFFNDLDSMYYLILIIPFLRLFLSSKNYELQYNLNYKSLFELKVYPRIYNLIITVLLLILNFGVISIIIGEIIGQLTYTISSRKNFRVNKLHLFNTESYKLFIKGYMVLLSRFVRLVRSNLDKVLIIPFLSPELIAAVNVIDKPANFIVTFLKGTINKVSLPYLSKYRNYKIKNLVTLFLILMLFEIISISILREFSFDIVEFLFSNKYSQYSVFIVWGLHYSILKYLNSYLFVHFASETNFRYEFYSGLFLLSSISIITIYFWNFQYISLLKFLIGLELINLFFLGFKVNSLTARLVICLKILLTLILIYFYES